MLCAPKELNKTILFVRTTSYDEILKLEKICKSTLGRNLGAMEYLDNFSYLTTCKNV